MGLKDLSDEKSMQLFYFCSVGFSMLTGISISMLYYVSITMALNGVNHNGIKILLMLITLILGMLMYLSMVYHIKYFNKLIGKHERGSSVMRQ